LAIFMLAIEADSVVGGPENNVVYSTAMTLNAGRRLAAVAPMFGSGVLDELSAGSNSTTQV
jgi:hypothetical protein